MSNFTMIYSNVPLNDTTPAWSAFSNYHVNDVVMWNKGIYRAIADSSASLPTDTSKWVLIGLCNRWSVHDGMISKPTTNQLSIRNIYQIQGQFDCAAFLSVRASFVTVKVYNAADQLAYNKTKSIPIPIGAASWDDFYFSPLASQYTDLLFDDIPTLANPVVDITISAPTGTVSCGEIILAKQMDIGPTQYGAKLGLTNYSTKEQNQFGDYNIVRRGFRKTGDFSVMIDNSNIDNFNNVLIRYKDTPILWIGSSGITSSMIYGFIKDYGITITYPENSLFNVSVEGLT